MIYTIAEHIATVMDSIILVAFLIYSFDFRNIGTPLKIALSILFMFLFFADTTILNQYTLLEGVLSITYLLILFAFCRIALRGKWWHHLLLVLVDFSSIFLVNAVILIISSMILASNYSEILLLRNPARIFLLFLSKLSLIVFQMPIASYVRKKKMSLHLFQAFVATISLLITIIAGVIIEKMILDNILPQFYASIMMCCIAAIDLLLLFILIQFTLQNRAAMNRVALETRLKDDEIKRQESLRWNRSVRTLQHDLNNHMTVIAQYIEQNETEKALAYIKGITGNITGVPQFTDTNNSTLNALLDLKRMTCDQEGINLKCYIQTDLMDFDDIAFSTVFGNLMDNAIEAERKELRKEIRIAVRMEGTYLHITVQNRIHQPVLINGSLPHTSKADKHHHGLGMYSITETIRRNHGVIDITEKDDWLLADVLLPCSIEKT